MRNTISECFSIHPPHAILSKMEVSWDSGVGEIRSLCLNDGIVLLMLPEIMGERVAVFSPPHMGREEILDRISEIL